MVGYWARLKTETQLNFGYSTGHPQVEKISVLIPALARVGYGSRPQVKNHTRIYPRRVRSGTRRVLDIHIWIAIPGWLIFLPSWCFFILTFSKNFFINGTRRIFFGPNRRTPAMLTCHMNIRVWPTMASLGPHGTAPNGSWWIEGHQAS
jgi:hypothetical protein